MCFGVENYSVTVISTTKTDYKVKIVILSPWPLYKRSFKCRSVNKS